MAASPDTDTPGWVRAWLFTLYGGLLAGSAITVTLNEDAPLVTFWPHSFAIWAWWVGASAAFICAAWKREPWPLYAIAAFPTVGRAASLTWELLPGKALDWDDATGPLVVALFRLLILLTAIGIVDRIGDGVRAFARLVAASRGMAGRLTPDADL